VDNKIPWNCSISLRICHPTLNPHLVTQLLEFEPTIADAPGLSRVPFGECKSAGYWCGTFKAEYPDRPTVLFEWLEALVSSHENAIQKLLNDGCDIYAYVGIHTNVLATGFDLPQTPTVSRLQLRVGIEFFSR